MELNRLIIVTILIFIVSAIAGAGIAIYKIKSWQSENLLKIGSWETLGGKEDVDKGLLNIASLAVNATFPLKKSEVIYFTANRDEKGNDLLATKEYLIEGQKLDARYWSIVAYDQDGFLIRNDSGRYNYNFKTVKYDPDNKHFKIHLSPDRRDGNWLPIKNAEKVILLIRLYHPDEKLRQNLKNTPLPVIKEINPQIAQRISS